MGSPDKKTETFQIPEHLYKIISTKDWEASLPLRMIKPSELDKNFIHLATEEQVQHVLKKFWAKSPAAVILKIDPKKLKGKLVKEKNPGGETEYFHLYGGGIPIEAVDNVAVINPNKMSL